MAAARAGGIVVTTGRTELPGGSIVVTSTAITAGSATVIEMAALPLPLVISLSAQCRAVLGEHTRNGPPGFLTLMKNYEWTATTNPHGQAASESEVAHEGVDAVCSPERRDPGLWRPMLRGARVSAERGYCGDRPAARFNG